jgi:imidazolonepropionase
MATVLRNARIASFEGDQPWGWINRGALVIEGEHLAWVGDETALPSPWREAEAEDLRGALLTPGLIDAHTHLVYGGDRAAEFEQRLQGVSYEEIARRGGGIRSTVAATREASDEQLFTAAAQPRC